MSTHHFADDRMDHNRRGKSLSRSASRVLTWLILFSGAMVPPESLAQEMPTRFDKATLIYLDGTVNRPMFEYFQTHLERAQANGSDLIVLVIDSPGGLLNEGLLMGQMLLDVKDATTVALIPKRALSSAAILSLGCDYLIMGENARWGDAGVIQLDDSFMFQYVEAKLLTDVVRQVRDMAQANGRSPELAEAIVDRTAVVYRRDRAGASGVDEVISYAEVDDDGKVAVEAKPPEIQEGELSWEVVPETKGNRFLEVNADRAIELGLAIRKVASTEAFVDSLTLTSPPRVIRYSTTDSVVYWLTRPAMTFLLILIGLVALYFELSAPGISVGGLISGLCFVLFFWSRFMGGTAGLLEIVLFVSGVVFIFVELFVIPGFGVAGILGLVLMVASIIMAGQRFIIPENQLELRQLTQSLGLVLGALFCFGISAMVISRRMGSIPILNRLILSHDDEQRGERLVSDQAKPYAAVKVGDYGVAESVLRPAGKVRFSKRSLDVISDGSYVEPGTPVQVVEISGNRIMVAPDETTT